MERSNLEGLGRFRRILSSSFSRGGLVGLGLAIILTLSAHAIAWWPDDEDYLNTYKRYTNRDRTVYFEDFTVEPTYQMYPTYREYEGTFLNPYVIRDSNGRKVGEIYRDMLTEPGPLNPYKVRIRRR
jgi:hypothetical protein